MDEKNSVSKDMHDGRCKIEDERFARDKERLDGMESNVDKLTTVSVQMGEILKHNNETLANHGDRLTAIECKPSKMVESVKTALLITLGGAFVTALVALIFK